MKKIKNILTKSKKIDLLIVTILFVGLLYRVLITMGGNFIFHIDSARDILAVREIVVLHHLRLIGSSTGIDGLFNGPVWYYLLSIPFILSKGNPYANVLLMNFFWFIGGYVLLSMTKKWGVTAFTCSAALWIASNYLLLASVYSYSPNPVTFLSPIFIYCLAKFIETGKMNFALMVGFLSAFFWNLEMAFGLFVPFIIIVAIIFNRKLKLIKTKQFLLGVIGPQVLGILPQILFELRHNFFMTKSVYIYLTEQRSLSSTFILGDRVDKSRDIFFEGFRGTFMNQPILIYIGIVIITTLGFFLITRRGRVDVTILTAVSLLIVPFIGFIFAPLVIQRWHVDPSLASLIILTGFVLAMLEKIKKIPLVHFLTWTLTIVIIIFSVINLHIPEYFNQDRPVADPAYFKNQLAAIDYAYTQAAGKNFKTYVYSPAIIDLPYQYNFWWYGQNTKYGYLPKDYTYLPSQPEYIKYKDQYSNHKNPPDSGLVILIKEPGNPKLEDLWKNSFTSLKLIKSENLGPLLIEVRRENL